MIEDISLLSIPLPFIVGLVFVLTLYPGLKGAEAPLARRYFAAFLALYAGQAIIVSLRFGYGVSALAPVQPVTAALMPPLAFLAFRAMADEPPVKPWRHLAGPLAVAFSVAFARFAIDALLLVLFCGYGFALWRFTKTVAEPAAEAPFRRARRVLRAARLTAALMMFFGVTDGLLFLLALWRGPGFVPGGVSLVNAVGLIILIVYYVWPEAEAAPVSAAPASPQEEALLSRLTAALETDGLFREENLSLARLARKAGMSAREASAAINRASGLNVSQFVNNRRIAEACRLLETTEKPLMDVMYDCGFSTKSNFNREFRRVTGQSPGQYRAARRRAS